VPDRRILLADDSPTIQKVVNLTFADEGIDVVCASDGDAAYQMVSQFTPDLVLADVNMPGKSGYELCQALRDREETRKTPVILLVGSFEPFDEEKALEVGANDYLTKPFQSIRQLVATVSELMGKGESAADVETARTETTVEEDVAELGTSYTEDPEPDDIDDLYRQSLHETVELPRPETSDYSNLGDPGLDDELIETEVAESVKHDDDVHVTSETSDILEPIDTSDFKFTEAQYDSSEEIRFEDTIRDEFPPAPVEPVYDAQSNLNGRSQYESNKAELHLVAPSDHSEEVTREFDIVESPAPNIPETQTGTVEMAEMPDKDETANTDEYPDVNVLDLPDSAPVEQVERPVAEPPSYQPFSPEMIDHLADRVAERVAQSLARHLAREVVPDVVRLIEEDRKRDS
jgi:CheY-like chemotaxis protein